MLVSSNTNTPITKNPAWETLENASIRLTLDCTSAEILPTVMVKAAKIQNISCH